MDKTEWYTNDGLEAQEANTPSLAFEEIAQQWQLQSPHEINNEERKSSSKQLSTGDAYEKKTHSRSLGTFPYGSITHSNNIEERITSPTGDCFALTNKHSRTTGEAPIEYPSHHFQSYQLTMKNGLKIKSEFQSRDDFPPIHPNEGHKRKPVETKVTITYPNGAESEISVINGQEFKAKVDGKTWVTVKLDGETTKMTFSDGTIYEFDHAGMKSVTRSIHGKPVTDTIRQKE